MTSSPPMDAEALRRLGDPETEAPQLCAEARERANADFLAALAKEAKRAATERERAQRRQGRPK